MQCMNLQFGRREKQCRVACGCREMRTCVFRRARCVPGAIVLAIRLGGPRSVRTNETWTEKLLSATVMLIVACHAAAPPGSGAGRYHTTLLDHGDFLMPSGGVVMTCALRAAVAPQAPPAAP